MLNSITEKYKESLAKDNDNNHQAKILQGPNLRPIVSDRKAFWETPEKVKTHGVRKSLIQHCERSELGLHFEWTKVD